MTYAETSAIVCTRNMLSPTQMLACTALTTALYVCYITRSGIGAKLHLIQSGSCCKQIQAYSLMQLSCFMQSSRLTAVAATHAISMQQLLVLQHQSERQLSLPGIT